MALDKSVVWAIVLLAFVLVGVGGYYLWRYLQNRPVKCNPPAAGWDPLECNSVLEKSYDPSMPTGPPVYLSSFTYDSGFNLGRPWCAASWYAARYADPKTGKYGPLGPWTSLPVKAGAAALP